MKTTLLSLAFVWSLAATAKPPVIVPDLPEAATGNVSEEAREAARLAREAFGARRQGDALEYGERLWEKRPNASTALFYAIILSEFRDPCDAFELLLAAADLDPTATERSAIERELRKTGPACAPGYGYARLVVVSPADATLEVGDREVPAGRLIGLRAGQHEVEVRAEGYQTYRERITVRRGDSATHRFQLARVSQPDAEPGRDETIEITETGDGRGAWRTPTGATLTAVGGVAMVAGVVLFIQAVGKRDDANDLAAAPEGADSMDRLNEYNALVSSMDSLQTGAWVAMSLGAAAVAGGIVVLATGPDSPTAGVSVSPDGAAVLVQGRF